MLDQVFYERLRELLNLKICVRNEFARKLNIEIKHLLPIPGTVKCLIRSSELYHNSLLLLSILLSLLLILRLPFIFRLLAELSDLLLFGDPVLESFGGDGGGGELGVDVDEGGEGAEGVVLEGGVGGGGGEVLGEEEGEEEGERGGGEEGVEAGDEGEEFLFVGEVFLTFLFVKDQVHI